MNALTQKHQISEEDLLEEIKTLKEYNARYSEDRFLKMEQEIKKLREDLERERKARIEIEQQYKQENQELMHLYIDAEVSI